MDEEKFSYLTLKSPTEEILLKEKGSKFLGFASAATSETEVKSYLEKIRTLHPKATHHCYAFRLGLMGEKYRANDDGEPGGSAGLPVYNQLLSYNLTNILVIVVRYYGGTKLGVGGLVKAYRETAKLTLESAEIISRDLTETLELTFDFHQQNQIFTLLNKTESKILAFKTEEKCTVTAEILKVQEKNILQQLSELQDIKINFLKRD